jgi:Tol biopolymer transport system component
MRRQARRFRFVLMALLAAGVWSCQDHAGPGGVTAHFALAPTFASGSAGIVDIDSVRVRLFRANDELALDTVVAVAADAESVALDLRVLVETSDEVFQMFLEFVSPTGETVFTGGPVAVSPSSEDTEPVVIDVEVVYVGVGSNAASVEITSQGATVLFGDTVQLTAVALDGQGQPIPGTPIAWSSLDPTRATVPNEAVGDVVGGSTRGTAVVQASLLTGPIDTASVLVQPTPTLIVLTGGNDQSGTVGNQLPVPITVLVSAADQLPVQGVPVLFQTGDGGTFSADSVDTDVNGEAQSLWTLGAGVGAQSATATVAGFPTVQATVGATAAAGLTVSWSNAAGGDWSDPANWTPNQVPGAGDTAVIVLDGVYTVSLGADATVAALSVGGVTGLQKLAPTAATLTITGNATVSPSGELDLNGAGVSGAGVLTQGGVLRASGGTTTLNMATVNNGLVDVQAGDLQVQVGVTGTGSGSVASAASLTVLGGASVDLAGSSTFDGALTVQAGAGVVFNGGTHTLGSSSSVSGAGDFDVLAGSVTVLGTYDLTGTTGVLGGTLSFENSITPAVTADLFMSAGTLGGAGDLEVLAALGWTGGTMSGGGVTKIGPSATGDLFNGAKVLDGRGLVNNGTVTWTAGDIDVRNGAAIANGASATLNLDAPDGSVLDNTVGGPVTLTNDGTTTVASDGFVSVTLDVVNNGTLDLQMGALDLNGGFTHADGAVLQGTATLNLVDATVTALDGDVNPGTSPGALSINGALPLSALSTVNLDLNGTTAGSQYDQLIVTDVATLNGTINVTAGFTPQPGDQFTVMTFLRRAGALIAVNGLDLGGGIVLDTVWTSSALTLEVPVPKIVFAGDSSGGLSTGIFTVNADSTGHVHVDTLIPIGYQRQYPRWSPDRKRIAYSWDAGVLGPLQLYVTSGAAGGLPQAVVTDTSAFEPRWSPNGMHLAFQCGDGFSIVDACVIGDVTAAIGLLPVNTYAVVSGAVGLPPAWQAGQSGFSWDPQNPDRLVFARDSTGINDVSMLWTAAYDGSGVQRLAPAGLSRPSDGAPLIVYGALDYSPNGQQIVFAAYSPLDAMPMEKLFVINRDGTGLRQLTFLAGYDDSPVYSPTGNEVLFGRDLDGCDYDGWIVDITNTDGSLERAITNEHVCDFDTDLLGADWSPDGSEIVLTGFSSGNTLIYVVPRTVTAATYLTVRRLVGRGVGAGFVQDIQPSWRP